MMMETVHVAVVEEEVPSGQSVPLNVVASNVRTPVKVDVAMPSSTEKVWKDDGCEQQRAAASEETSRCRSSSASTSTTSHDSHSPCSSLSSVVEVRDLEEDVLLPAHDEEGEPFGLSAEPVDGATRRSPDESPSSFRHGLQAVLYQKNQEVAARLRDEVVARLLPSRPPREHEQEEGDGRPSLPPPPPPASPPLVLVSGPLGSGKSHLAQSIRDAVEVDLCGYLVTARCCTGGGVGCNQPHDGIHGSSSSVPYPALASALEEFASAVLRRGPHEVARIRDAVQRMVGIEAFVLTRFVPSLQELLGNGDERAAFNDGCDSRAGEEGVASAARRPEPPTLCSDSDLRFNYVFKRFFRAVSCPDHPFVLLLDDVHDCDPCSLTVLASVLSGSSRSSNGFLVVGTIQPDRVPCDSALAETLRGLEDVDRGIEIAHFPLRDLEPGEILQAISGALRMDAGEVQALAEHIYGCTAGNPYHVSELVSYLEDVGYVTRNDGGWSLDKEGATDAASELVAGSISLEALLYRKLHNVSPECREALKVASCLGFRVDEELVGYALGYSVHHVLPDAEAVGLLTWERWGNSDEPRYRFANASVRRAARGLIPSEYQETFHLEMARSIWRRCDEAAAEKHVYTVLSLFQKCKSLIERPNERHAVATLCYHAGFMASRSSSFGVASEHFELGIQVLGPNRWRENYELSLSLCNAAAEMAMCTGNFLSMDVHLSDVLTHARLHRDTIQARATKIYYYGTSAAHQGDAVREGIKVLNDLGIDLHPNASKLRLGWEILRVRRALKGKTDSVILRMPTLVNAEKRSCLQILSLVYQNAMFAMPSLLPIVILRMIDITLQYGLSEFASIAFANYGVLCIEASGDVEMGYRYGSLGLAILDRFNANELVPRVYATFYKHISVHMKPVKDTLQPLAKAYRIGLYTGDLDAAFLCAIFFCLNCFDTGHPLPALEAEYSDIIRRMEASRQKSMLTTALPLAQCIRDLMGLSDDPLASSGDLINHDELMKTSEEAGRPLVVAGMLACRLTTGNVLNEFVFVSGFLDEFVTKYVDLIPTGSTRTCVKMSAGLCAIELARLGRNKRRNLRIAKSMIKSLRTYALHNPQFCLDKLYLVQAELASYQRDWSRARQKYLASVALSGANESLYSAAKANECFARHLLRRSGDDPESLRDSSKYFVDACRLYSEWGATAKVRRLEREVKELFPHLDCFSASRPTVRPSLKSTDLLEFSSWVCESRRRATDAVRSTQMA